MIVFWQENQADEEEGYRLEEMTFVEQEEVFPVLTVDDTLANKEDTTDAGAVEEKDTKQRAKRKEPEPKTEKKVMHMLLVVSNILSHK